MTRLGYRQSPDHIQRRLAAQGIVAKAPLTPTLDATERDRLIAEIDRLHGEVERLSKIALTATSGGAPILLPGRGDIGHPMYRRWVELGLDDQAMLTLAWEAVTADRCVMCDGPLVAGPHKPLKTCDACQMCWLATDGRFAIDTLDRAIDRGADE